MFGPIAAAYPQHARAILTMEMHNLAPLVLFGVLSLMSTLGAWDRCPGPTCSTDEAPDPWDW